MCSTQFQLPRVMVILNWKCKQ